VAEVCDKNEAKHKYEEKSEYYIMVKVNRYVTK